MAQTLAGLVKNFAKLKLHELEVRTETLIDLCGRPAKRC
jgi:hypothetical protein